VRHVRMLGLCLVAALALGAYAVSSASALEWGKCENVGSGGNYTGPNCTKSEKAKPKGTGSYEWRKASEVAEKRVAEGKSANVPFAGESVGGGGVLSTSLRECKNASTGEPAIRVTRQQCREDELIERVYFKAEPAKVECATETNTGEAEGKNKIANVHVTFTACNLFGSFVCEQEGKEPGEIETSTLKGKLGWIDKSEKEVGVLLEPAQHHGRFTEFACGGIGVVVGVGNKKEGTEYVQGENYPEGCFGAPSAKEPEGGCPKATPTEEKHGGYDGVISPITPVNQMTSEFTQVYTEEPEYPHRNLPTHFEGKHIDLLEDYQTLAPSGYEEATHTTGWSSAGEVITNVNTPEEEGEIKA
jgi:hypothetical protein